MADRCSRWAEQLKARGIRTIGGRIIGDDNAFDDDGLGFGWAWDDLPDDYAAGVSALQFNENACASRSVPGPAAGDWRGRQRFARRQRPGGREPAHDIGAADSAGVDRGASAARQLAAAVCAARCRSARAPVSRDVSVDNPTLFFVNALRSALIAHGIDVRGPAVDIDDIRDAPPRPDGAPLVSHRSPPLSTLARPADEVSQNLYAETLLKTLGGRARRRSTAAGRSSAQAVLQAWGVRPRTV